MHFQRCTLFSLHNRYLNIGMVIGFALPAPFFTPSAMFLASLATAAPRSMSLIILQSIYTHTRRNFTPRCATLTLANKENPATHAPFSTSQNPIGGDVLLSKVCRKRFIQKVRHFSTVLPPFNCLVPSCMGKRKKMATTQQKAACYDTQQKVYIAIELGAFLTVAKLYPAALALLLLLLLVRVPSCVTVYLCVCVRSGVYLSN